MKRSTVVLLGIAGATVVSLWGPGAVTPAGAPASPPFGESLSADPRGWAFHPTVAVAIDGTVYVAWSQHMRPENWQHVGTWVKRWAHGSWQALGGRIGHTNSDPGGRWTEGYAPSLAILDGTPYVAWYEGGGYGWGTIGSTNIRSSVFVAHWDGSQWTLDPNAGMPNRALNTDPEAAARAPVLAAVGGVLHAAWIEVRRVPERGAFNVVVVKRLSGGRWLPVGQEIRAESADNTRMLDLTLVDAGGSPHVAWSEAATANAGMPNRALNTDPEAAARAPVLAAVGGVLHAAWIEVRRVPERGAFNVVVVKRLSGGRWLPVGQEIRAESADNTRMLDLTLVDAGGSPHVAWSEAATANGGGRPQVHVAKWTGSEWTRIGRSLNVSRGGFANYVALTGSASALHLAWQERSIAGPNQVFVKSWDGRAWTAAPGSLNVDPDRGEAGRPALVSDGSRVWLAWTEGGPGQRGGLYARALGPGGWGSPIGPLNADREAGAPDGPTLGANSGSVYLAWAEKNPPPATKQVYVRVLP